MLQTMGRSSTDTAQMRRLSCAGSIGFVGGSADVARPGVATVNSERHVVRMESPAAAKSTALHRCLTATAHGQVTPVPRFPVRGCASEALFSNRTDGLVRLVTTSSSWGGCIDLLEGIV